MSEKSSFENANNLLAKYNIDSVKIEALTKVSADEKRDEKMSLHVDLILDVFLICDV